jgi:hypothetical protein
MLLEGLRKRGTPEDQRAIESALGSLSGGEAVTKIIRDGLASASGAGRISVLNVVARRQGWQAVPLFLAETRHSDPTVARTAFRLLGRVAEPQQASALMDRLTEKLEPEVRPEAEAAAVALLSRMDPPAARSRAVLAAWGKATNLEGKQSLIRLLPSTEGPEGLELLSRLLTENDPSLQRAAREAILEWPTLEAWPFLQAELDSGEARNRSAAFAGMSRLLAEHPNAPREKLVPAYATLLARAQNDAERKQAMAALGSARTPDVIDLIAPWVKSEGTRAEAIAALRSVAAALKDTDPAAAARALNLIPK